MQLNIRLSTKDAALVERAVQQSHAESRAAFTRAAVLATAAAIVAPQAFVQGLNVAAALGATPAPPAPQSDSAQ